MIDADERRKTNQLTWEVVAHMDAGKYLSQKLTDHCVRHKSG
jgi:hypothetical protein